MAQQPDEARLMVEAEINVSESVRTLEIFNGARAFNSSRDRARN
jgi:hypothetical protein